MSLKNHGDSITVDTSGAGRRRLSVRCYRKWAPLSSREASPVVVVQLSAGAVTAVVAEPRQQQGRWHSRFLLLFHASEMRTAALTDARTGKSRSFLS
jgi:hypothetical protein